MAAEATVTRTMSLQERYPFAFITYNYGMLVEAPLLQRQVGYLLDHVGTATLDEVREIVAADPDFVKTIDAETGELPLHIFASACRKEEILEYLIECYPAAVRTLDYFNQTPLLAMFENEVRVLPSMEYLHILLDRFPQAAGIPDKEGSLPLHLLLRNVQGNPVDIARDLIQACPSQLLCRDDRGRTPLHMACGFVDRRFERDIVSVLLEYCPEAAKARDHKGDLPLHYVGAGGSQTTLQSLMEAFPAGGTVKNWSGRTPLHTACTYDHTMTMNDEFFCLFVASCPEAAGERDQQGQLPLSLYTRNNTCNSVAVLKSIVEAYPAALAAKDEFSRTVLHSLCLCKHRPFPGDEYFGFVLERSPVTACRERDSNGSLPLHLAFQVLNAEDAVEPDYFVSRMDRENRILPGDEMWHRVSSLSIARLVESYPDARREPNPEGKTAIELAIELFGESDNVSLDNIRAMEHLVRGCPASLSRRNAEGQVPLHKMCKLLENHEMPASYLPFLKLAIDTCPDACKVTDNHGRLPLHILCAESNKDVVSGAIRHMVKTYPGACMVADADGRLPLHFLCLRQHDDGSIRQVFSVFPRACLVADRNGQVPLHLACRSLASAAMIQLLIELDAEAALRTDNDDNLPLHCACAKFDHEIRERLVILVTVNPGSVAARNRHGRLPIEETVQSIRGIRVEECDFVYQALQFLADFSSESLSIPDGNGQIPLHKVFSSITTWEERARGFQEIMARKEYINWAVSIVKLMIDTCPESVDLLDRRGNLPLVYACSNEHPSPDLIMLLTQHSLAAFATIRSKKRCHP